MKRGGGSREAGRPDRKTRSWCQGETFWRLDEGDGSIEEEKTLDAESIGLVSD